MLCGMNGVSQWLSHSGSERLDDVLNSKLENSLESKPEATQALSLPLRRGMHGLLPAVLLAAAKRGLLRLS